MTDYLQTHRSRRFDALPEDDATVEKHKQLAMKKQVGMEEGPASALMPLVCSGVYHPLTHVPRQVGS